MFGIVERMPTPGAAISTHEPYCEKLASRSLESVAATAIQFV